jgi:hypothetical protein
MRLRILAYAMVALAGILTAVLGSLVYPPTAISAEVMRAIEVFK